MATAKATTTANTLGTTSHMLIWERHHGTLGPTATLTLAHWGYLTVGSLGITMLTTGYVG